MRFISASLAALALVASNVAAHSVITAVTGANGVTGTGFGVVDATGKTTKLFDQAARFVNAQSGLCGVQKITSNKAIDVTTALKAATAPGKLATAAADGTVTMTLFQVNGDGAGPYTCQVSADGTGNDFKAMQIVTQVPGTKGTSRASNTAFPLVAKLPAGTKCAGAGGACLVQCKSALSAPFGGCVAVSQAAGAAAAPAKAAPAKAAPAKAAPAKAAPAKAAPAKAAPAKAAPAKAAPAKAVPAKAAPAKAVKAGKRILSRLFNLRAMHAGGDHEIAA